MFKVFVLKSYLSSCSIGVSLHNLWVCPFVFDFIMPHTRTIDAIIFFSCLNPLNIMEVALLWVETFVERYIVMKITFRHTHLNLENLMLDFSVVAQIFSWNLRAYTDIFWILTNITWWLGYNQEECRNANIYCKTKFSKTFD